ncbi:hypothetical protein C8J57DRAFT_1709273 [Mycena rebaudengoi]|nr:hypothetical protein C8J57DRAFT_1709273 [Mycena rebaudengoi]
MAKLSSEDSQPAPGCGLPRLHPAGIYHPALGSRRAHRCIFNMVFIQYRRIIGDPLPRKIEFKPRHVYDMIHLAKYDDDHIVCCIVLHRPTLRRSRRSRDRTASHRGGKEGAGRGGKFHVGNG